MTPAEAVPAKYWVNTAPGQADRERPAEAHQQQRVDRGDRVPPLQDVRDERVVDQRQHVGDGGEQQRRG